MALRLFISLFSLVLEVNTHDVVFENPHILFIALERILFLFLIMSNKFAYLVLFFVFIFP